MTRNLIRQVIRAHLEEASRARRQQTRATIAAASDLPTTQSGRVDTAKQIALTGYNLAKDSAGMPPRYGFTMTSIQKVGINPASGFETPLALYAYPVTPMMVSNLTGGKNLDIALNMPEIEGEIPQYADVDYALPFVDKAPYINFFGFNTQEGVFYTSVGMDDGKYRAAIDMLFRQFSGNKALGADNPERRFRQLLVQAQRHNRVGTQNAPGVAKPSSEMTDYFRLATVWTLTRALSMVSVAADLDAFEAGAGPPPTRSTISTWRALLLMVGIKAVVDDEAKGLIHKNEPEQIAIMDASIIKPIQQFDNTTTAVKFGKDDDAYWRNNRNDRANAAAETKLKEIQIAVDSLEQSPAVREFENLTYAINPVYYSSWMTRKVVGELKRSGLDNRIVKIVLDYGLREYPTGLLAGTYFYVAVHDLAGDNRIVDEMTSKLMTDPGAYFDAIKALITSLRGESDRYVKKFIIDFFDAAFKKGTGLAAQSPGEAKSMLVALASSPTVQSALSMGYFMQLVMPIIKALPREDQTSSFSAQSGERMPLADMLRELFGGAERAKAVAKEKMQIQALEKKREQRPTTDDLYANLGDLDKLKARLKQVLSRARLELKDAQNLVSDRNEFFKNGGHINVDDYAALLSRFHQTTIQSATLEQLQQAEAIWTQYVAKVRELARGPNYLQMTNSIVNNNPGASNDVINDLMSTYMHAHAFDQVTKFRQAIEVLEAEMTAQIESMDDKSVETAPLYERLIDRWMQGPPVKTRLV